jgi:hypothetical protein
METNVIFSKRIFLRLCVVKIVKYCRIAKTVHNEDGSQ